MILFLNENENIENYSIPSTIQAIDEIDDISNSISDNISKEVKIPSEVLNSFAIKNELNPKIWEGNKLKPIVRTKLVKIANDFFKELNLPKNVKLKDIIFTGSLANFNWSKFSDIDLHIVLDFDTIKGDDNFKENFFYAQKSLWNQSHDITVYDYPVELYAQDLKAKLIATAVYSVKNDKWVLEPKREEFKVNKKLIKQKADRFIDRLKIIKNDYEKGDLQSVIDRVKILKDKIKKYRTSGLEDNGEFSIENLVFKTLRRTPFMDILDSYKAKAYDKLMSVKENEDMDIKKLIKESLRENLNMLEVKTKFDSSMADVFRTMFRIAKAQEMYGPNSEVDDNVKQYFDSEYEGQAVLPILISPRGDARLGTNTNSAANNKANDKIGFIRKNASYMWFNIMANRGIEHPNNEPRDNFAITRKGLQSADDDSVLKTSSGRKRTKETEYLQDNQKLVSFIYGIKNQELKQNIINIINDKGLDGVVDVEYDVPGSPASDAIIKAYLIYGEMILDYVITNTEGFDAYTSYSDAKTTDAYKQMSADPERMKQKLRMDFRTMYKEKTSKEPTEQEIRDFLQSGEEDIEKYLQNLNSEKQGRDLVSNRYDSDIDINSLNPMDQRKYRTYMEIKLKKERGQELTNDEKSKLRIYGSKFEKLKKGL